MIGSTFLKILNYTTKVMKTGKVLLSVVLAASAGLAIGMLFAPDKGVRTRRKIREKGEDYLEDLKGEYEHSLKNFKKKVDTAIDDVTSKLGKQPEKV